MFDVNRMNGIAIETPAGTYRVMLPPEAMKRHKDGITVDLKPLADALDRITKASLEEQAGLQT